ncbi:MAG: hypothetical protein HKO63_05370 [Acidimicrobiia bacterium]|nr:DUF4307 domain-containing protein [Acidimicrobiia bacterium]NNL97616.1 hypothetical protein [Acidimicrobiia bacterium]
MEAPLDKQILTLKKRDRWLAWLAGILVVAVVAMGAWMIFGDDGGQSLTAAQEQMLETVDQALVAWNAHDGEALAALYMPSGYHDNGSMRYYVAEGKLADYVTSLGSMTFSVRSGEHYVIGNLVFSEGYVPQQSETVRPGIHAMSADGKRILWHLAP